MSRLKLDFDDSSPTSNNFEEGVTPPTDYYVANAAEDESEEPGHDPDSYDRFERRSSLFLTILRKLVDLVLFFRKWK